MSQIGETLLFECILETHSILVRPILVHPKILRPLTIPPNLDVDTSKKRNTGGPRARKRERGCACGAPANDMRAQLKLATRTPQNSNSGNVLRSHAQGRVCVRNRLGCAPDVEPAVQQPNLESVGFPPAYCTYRNAFN